MEMSSDLTSWDYFFYYGKNDLETECRRDLLELLMQPSRSLFYFRRGSSGISEFENNPNGMRLQILGRYAIANAIAYRNTYVTDGTDDTRDRRIAVSQAGIEFSASSENLDIEIQYILYAFFNQLNRDRFPI